jgi:hypothetical protein
MKRILSRPGTRCRSLFSSAAWQVPIVAITRPKRVPTTDASKDVATVQAPDKMDTNQVQTAQANPQPAKPAPAAESKK